MRKAFIEALCELAEVNEKIWLLTGDLGFSVLEPFASKFPNRYINVGVAEQNMTGVAAGLALSGKIVLTYSIANFPVIRCLEQVRNDICYHNLDVKIVAVGGGLAYGSAGYTHHALEDLAIMRAMPNMAVIAPGDPVETRLATFAIINRPGPCYLRLGKAREPLVHTVVPDFVIGKSIRIRSGTDLAFISTGGILSTVMEAAGILESKGYSIGVISMHSITPLDTNAIIGCAVTPGRIITVEEHGKGGLGSAVAEALIESEHPADFKALTVHGNKYQYTGSQERLRKLYNLSSDALVDSALEMLTRDK